MQKVSAGIAFSTKREKCETNIFTTLAIPNRIITTLQNWENGKVQFRRVSRHWNHKSIKPRNRDFAKLQGRDNKNSNLMSVWLETCSKRCFVYVASLWECNTPKSTGWNSRTVLDYEREICTCVCIICSLIDMLRAPVLKFIVSDFIWHSDLIWLQTSFCQCGTNSQISFAEHPRF